MGKKDQGRTHRERAQPASRAHLGALEKKKDYKKRAEDYQEKERTLKTLRKHAMDKNHDEYHLDMTTSKTDNSGVHWNVTTKEQEELSAVQRKLGDVKDLEYVKHKLHAERKKIAQMKAELHMADANTGLRSKHTIFVDDDNQAKKFDPVAFLDTDAALIGRKYNRPRVADLVNKTIKGAIDKEHVKAADRARRVRYNELLKRIERERELAVVVKKLEVKRDVAASIHNELRPVKVRKGNAKRAAVYKFATERKK